MHICVYVSLALLCISMDTLCIDCSVLVKLCCVVHAMLLRLVLLMSRTQLSKLGSNFQQSELIYVSRCFASDMKLPWYWWSETAVQG